MTVNRAAFFASVRKGFGPLKQSQVDGFNALLDAWDGQDPRFVAYGLATSWHETAKTMKPIEEYGKGKGRPYGKSGFWGRGFVQLTWDYNYRKAGQKIGVDLLKNPALALEPCNAAKIMVGGMLEGWFTGKKLSDYFNAHRDDPVEARRIINGLDKANLIATYHGKFLTALKAGGANVNVAQKPSAPPPPPDIHPVESPPAPAKPGVFSWLFGRK